MHEKVQKALQTILERFKSGDISAIAACLKAIDEAEKVLSVILGQDQGNGEKAAINSEGGRDENGKADLERERV